MKTWIAIVLVVMVGLVSCTEQGAVMSGLSVDMKATTTVSKLTSGRIQGSAAYTFEKAIIGVRQFEFKTQAEDESESHNNSGSSDSNDDSKHDGDDDHGGGNHGNDDGGSGNDDSNDDNGDDDNDTTQVEFKGSYVVDLIKGTSDPELTNGNLIPGTYVKFEVKVAPVLPDGNSFEFVFNYLPDGATDSVKVELSSKARLKFQFKDPNGITVVDDKLTNYLVLIDLDKLLGGLDLSAAVASDDGVIRVNDTSNAILLKALKANLDKSCRGGHDDDHDEHIDDDND